VSQGGFENRPGIQRGDPARRSWSDGHDRRGIQQFRELLHQQAAHAVADQHGIAQRLGDGPCVGQIVVDGNLADV
jgi:hypothetical protein